MVAETARYSTGVMTVLQVDVAQVVVDAQNQPVMLLKPRVGDTNPARLLPIWIGPQEATAIVLALDDEAPPRPMSYDLMYTLLTTLAATVRQVAITRLDEGTFYAEITLDSPAGPRVVDARPSDSIALAVRAGAPIFVAEDVFAVASMEVEDRSGATAEPDAEAEVERFSEFLDTVDPDDFRG
jgi:bifunctional DNase/RNase